MQPHAPEEMLALDIVLATVDDLVEAGAHEEALRILEDARASFPPDARVETARGWSLENLGPARLKEAPEAYREAIRLDPHALSAREGLGNVLFAMGEIDAANELYREVVDEVERLGGDNPEARKLEGWCLYKLEEFDRAVAVFTQALARDGNITAMRFDLGLALLAKGEVGRAVVEYGTAITQLRRATPNRRIGMLMVALDDLEAGIRDRPSIRANYSAHVMQSRLAWELSEARAGNTATFTGDSGINPR